MAEAEGIPPTASVASVGPRINYVGNFAYAYSGNITLPDATLVEALNFTSGAGVIRSKFQYSVDVDALSTEYLRLFITFNDESIVYNFESRGAGAISDMPMYLIIPPFTLVKVKLQGGSDAIATAWMTGRVYDV